MQPQSSTEPRTNPFAAADVETVLREGGWLAEKSPAYSAWLERAAALLGPQAAEGAADEQAARVRLGDLLSLVFQYDARGILGSPDAHAVLLRSGARDVIRELALQVLGGPEVDSDRFKEIIETLKEKTGRRGLELFQPIRLALAGRMGSGELDRVILLLDGAAKLPFAARVKSARERMLEFCAALD